MPPDGDDGAGRSPPAPGEGHAMDGELGAVRSLYDRWSRVYDWNPVLSFVRPARRRAVAALDLEPGDVVVDMGTGTGANLPLLREAVGPAGRVVGVDASPGMLSRARARVAAAGWENVAVLEGDVRDPPLDGPVDAVCSAFVVVMYEDPRPLLEAWVDLLAEGGALANLYAGPSRGGGAPAANALLGAYLRVFEAGWEVGEGRTPGEVLARRGERARAALEDLVGDVRHEAHGLGLVKLDVGRR